MQVLPPPYLLLLLNCFLFSLPCNTVTLLLHDELMDSSLVDMQLIVATVLFSVDFSTIELLFNNLSCGAD